VKGAGQEARAGDHGRPGKGRGPVSCAPWWWRQGGAGVGTGALAGLQWQGEGADKVWPMLAVRLHEVMCPPGWRLRASGKDKAVALD
jgi:hypothetical protein